MFGGMNFFPEIPRPFNTQYRCYPVAMMPGGERSDVEAGGKIILSKQSVVLVGVADGAATIAGPSTLAWAR